METIEAAEQGNYGEAPEQSESASNISPNQSPLINPFNPFEVIQRLSADKEIRDRLISIFRLDSESPEVISQDEIKKLHNIGLPDVSLDNGESATLMEEIKLWIESSRNGLGNGVVDFLPSINTCTKNLNIKDVKTKDGMRSVFSLSHLLNNTEIWMFRYDGARAYDHINELQLKAMSPLMFAVFMSKPYIVHLLLQYGTRFLDELDTFSYDQDATSMRLICMRALLSDITKELFDSEMWDCDSLALKTDFLNLPQQLRSKCAKFRFLMRSDPHPYASSVEVAKLDYSKVPPLPEISVLRHVYDSLFPDLRFGVSSPPPLQHACRNVIRQRLLENWQLPDGITQLGLHKTLCDYVSLLDD